jgi:hypothetical protein
MSVEINWLTQAGGIPPGQSFFVTLTSGNTIFTIADYHSPKYYVWEVGESSYTTVNITGYDLGFCAIDNIDGNVVAIGKDGTVVTVNGSTQTITPSVTGKNPVGGYSSGYIQDATTGNIYDLSGTLIQSGPSSSIGYGPPFWGLVYNNQFYCVAPSNSSSTESSVLTIPQSGGSWSANSLSGYANGISPTLTSGVNTAIVKPLTMNLGSDLVGGSLSSDNSTLFVMTDSSLSVFSYPNLLNTQSISLTSGFNYNQSENGKFISVYSNTSQLDIYDYSSGSLSLNTSITLTGNNVYIGDTVGLVTQSNGVTPLSYSGSWTIETAISLTPTSNSLLVGNDLYGLVGEANTLVQIEQLTGTWRINATLPWDYTPTYIAKDLNSSNNLVYILDGASNTIYVYAANETYDVFVKQPYSYTSTTSISSFFVIAGRIYAPSINPSLPSGSTSFPCVSTLYGGCFYTTSSSPLVLQGIRNIGSQSDFVPLGNITEFVYINGTSVTTLSTIASLLPGYSSVFPDGSANGSMAFSQLPINTLVSSTDTVTTINPPTPNLAGTQISLASGKNLSSNESALINATGGGLVDVTP